jgi:ankyrin repeat protein
MFATRNGHEDVVRALIAGGADPKLTNADGATATVIAIVNDRFDLAKELLDLGADPNDGALFFAVDMHDATTDMRAHDGARLQPNHPNNLTALGLVKVLLDVGADVNKPFVGALHSTTLCCGAQINSSPFYRAATAADVEVLKLLLAKGAKIEWTPAEVKPKDGKGPARPNPNAGRTPLMAAIKGGNGAPIAGGPGFTRIGPPVFREPASRDPLEAIKLLLAAGADPNVKASDGSTPLHQAVQEEHVGMIRALAAAGGKLDAVNKDNLTPLLLAEAPKKPNPADMGDLDVYKPKRNSKEEVVAALRELMHLGPNDPAPQPPPLPAKDDKKASDDKEKKDTPKVPAVTSEQ